MSIRRRLSVTAFLVVLVTFSLVSAAFAQPLTCWLQGAGCQQEGAGVLQKLSVPGTCSLCGGNWLIKCLNCAQGQTLNNNLPVLGTESVALSAEEQQMLDLVNKERSSNGVGPLKSDPSLVKLARLKAQDMVDKHYFDHNSPTYGSPFDMMKSFGISYSYAGENLAMAPSVISAHNALMQSPGHRANILSQNYDRVGIGIVVSGGYRYCVQMFTGGQKDSGGTVQQQTQQQTQPSQQQSSQQQSQPSQQQAQVSQQPGLSADEALLLGLINKERAAAGLPQLAADSKLFQIASLKAKDFVDKGYFGHTSPTYGTFRNMLDSFGVSYVNAGENLAAAYTAERAHAALMKSSGNKGNILSGKYTRVGIGIANNGSYKYFVEIFADGGSAQPSSGGSVQSPSAGTAGSPSQSSSITPVNTQSPDTGSVGNSGLTADEQRMLDLVNAERAKNGAAPLKVNLKLTQMARIKAKDMIDNNYFDHTSPTYGSPFDMMRQFGISYMAAGENLAGAPSVDIAHTNLMNSPGHRANILNTSFSEIGIGIVDGGPYGKMFVQEFIG